MGRPLYLYRCSIHLVNSLLTFTELHGMPVYMCYFLNFESGEITNYHSVVKIIMGLCPPPFLFFPHDFQKTYNLNVHVHEDPL